MNRLLDPPQLRLTQGEVKSPVRWIHDGLPAFVGGLRPFLVRWMNLREGQIGWLSRRGGRLVRLVEFGDLLGG
jgi:hypothetical protein